MTYLKAKEVSKKVMWKSCKRVRCYLDTLDAKKYAKLAPKQSWSPKRKDIEMEDNIVKINKPIS